MADQLFKYSPIIDRRQLEMPEGARVALWIGVNIEYFDPLEPIATLQGRRDNPPSPSGYGWYSYGLRVGIFRVMDIMSRHGLRGSVLLNSDVCANYPEIIREGNRLQWIWLAHGKRNQLNQADFDSVEAERHYLQEMTSVIASATGHTPRGWLGPGLSESQNTPALLAELGYTYVCDWVADDQPFSLNVPAGRMIDVPYAIDGLNDIRFRDRGYTGEDYYQLIVDQFDMLYADGAKNPRVMCIAIHPHITGQPFRAKNFERAIEYIVRHDGVWLATSDEIADWYYSRYYPD